MIAVTPIPYPFGSSGTATRSCSFSSRTAHKIAFVRKNPKGAVSIGGNPYGSDGYLMKGTFAIEEDTESRWLREITFRYEPPELAEQHVGEWAGPDIVVMRFTPQKISKI